MEKSNYNQNSQEVINRIKNHKKIIKGYRKLTKGQKSNKNLSRTPKKKNQKKFYVEL